MKDLYNLTERITKKLVSFNSHSLVQADRIILPFGYEKYKGVKFMGLVVSGFADDIYIYIDNYKITITKEFK